MTSTEVNTILTAIAVIDEKIEGIRNEAAKQAEINRDHETRLRFLEKAIYLAAGAGLIGGGGLGALFSKII